MKNSVWRCLRRAKDRNKRKNDSELEIFLEYINKSDTNIGVIIIWPKYQNFEKIMIQEIKNKNYNIIFHNKILVTKQFILIGDPGSCE